MVSERASRSDMQIHSPRPHWFESPALRAPHHEDRIVRPRCAPISSTSNCPLNGSRCAPRIRAIPHGCWSSSLARRLHDRVVVRPAAMAQAGRSARRQRHQGDLGPTQGPADRPRDRAENRGDADQAARWLALAGAGQAGKKARARRRRSFRQRGQGLPARPPRCRSRGERRRRRGDVVVFVSRTDARFRDCRSRQPAAAALYRLQTRSRRARRGRLPDHVRRQ